MTAGKAVYLEPVSRRPGCVPGGAERRVRADGIGPAFHQVLQRGEELAMFDCGMDTDDSRLVLVLVYAAHSGHHNPIYAQWSMSIAFRDADVPHAHLSGEVCG
jgi:hypothetical protein